LVERQLNETSGIGKDTIATQARPPAEDSMVPDSMVQHVLVQVVSL